MLRSRRVTSVHMPDAMIGKGVGMRGKSTCVLAAVLACGCFPASALAKTFVVTTTADSGPGSLRDAINRADAREGLLDTITFDIGTGTQTIVPTSALPPVTEPVIIDATTQPGFTGTPLIRLDGARAGPATAGLMITGGDTAVRGLEIADWTTGVHLTAWGIALRDAGGNVIAGDQVVGNGNPSGNNSAGVLIDRGSSDNVIGGTTAGAANVISGNAGDGLSITGTGTTGNVVEGNDIGVDASGAPLANARDGVSIAGGASGSLIGGLGGQMHHVGNDISSNAGNGVSIRNRGTSGNVVLGDTIDSNALNGLDIVSGATDTTTGADTFAGAQNVGDQINANRLNGIYIAGSGTSNSNIFGDTIADNHRAGIVITAGASDNPIGAAGLTIASRTRSAATIPAS